MGCHISISARLARCPGPPGNASRRSFFGPGELNFDLALLKSFQFKEFRLLQFRIEAFNAFNHTNFFGPAAVNGNIDSTLFGQVVNASSAWFDKRALKFMF